MSASNAEAAGHPCLASIAQGTVCKILARHEVKPHKVRYYLERRDEDFETKMADVLCVYREVAIMRESETDADERRDHFLRREAGHPGDRQHRTRPAAATGSTRPSRAIMNTSATAR